MASESVEVIVNVVVDAVVVVVDAVVVVTGGGVVVAGQYDAAF